jgi:hypothetical protein
MRTKVSLLSVLALLTALTVGIVPSAQAETVEFPCGSNGATYSVLMPQGVLLGGKNCVGSLTIDKSVKVIGTEAFYRSSSITSVVIPEGVTLIDEKAFFSSSLKEITIPNSVTTINSAAFGFTGLTSLTLPNALTRITSQSFRNIKITSLIIPPSVKVIEYGAFTGVLINSIVIPNSVTEIGTGAFENSKFASVVIPDSVKILGSYVFKDNTTLSSISIPDGLQRIGLPAFVGNYSLTTINFCGSFPSGTFPIAQTCPADRQALIETNAAAELKAKQEADAKTALGKAQSELAAANAALSDSQKVNREQALKIISLEEQFRVSSESNGDLQSQISQLNSKLALAIKGQTSANAKIKKICSVKPKPKGC